MSYFNYFNPTNLIQGIMSGVFNPNMILNQIRMQNPLRFDQVMKEVDSLKQQGKKPQEVLIDVLGQNNPLLSTLKNLGINL